jgi:hypothetical protein
MDTKYSASAGHTAIWDQPLSDELWDGRHDVVGRQNPTAGTPHRSATGMANQARTSTTSHAMLRPVVSAPHQHLLQGCRSNGAAGSPKN